MRYLIGVWSAILLFVLSAGAQDTKPLTLRGYVVDRRCGEKMATKENAMEKAKAHTRECALNDLCAASGYGILSGGRYYRFDEKGSALAKSLLEKSKRTRGMYFVARGTVSRGMLTVSSLKESSPAGSTMMKKKGT
jgi:hypothetical protein